MNRIGIALAGLVILCASCKKEEAPKLATGDWLAKIEVSESQQLPFEFTLSQNEEGGYVMQAFNAEEVVTIDEFTFNGDSINIRMPVFEGHITGTYTTDRISGEFIEESKERRVPFVATYGKQDRFTVNEDAAVNLSGIWETYFDVNTEDEYAAKGIFMQNGNRLKGTFRTKTGDYRYLDGVVTGDSMKLSAFDGSHVFLFLAEVTDSTLNGKFYSGNHSVEEFMAARNEAFELPDSNAPIAWMRPDFMWILSKTIPTWTCNLLDWHLSMPKPKKRLLRVSNVYRSGKMFPIPYSWRNMARGTSKRPMKNYLC